MLHITNIPLASMLALLVSWIGLGFFCTKINQGLNSVHEIALQLFDSESVHVYMDKAKLAFLLVGLIMGLLTLCMAVVGICATRNCAFCECDPPIYSRWANCLGNRVICAAFVSLNYLLNACWLAIFTFLVGLMAIYLSFSPICLPQAGTVDSFCLNFSLVNKLLGAGDAGAVSLFLCGNPIDKFCKLTRSILPWFWWAYFGCIFVLLGLSSFNSCLSANFAHTKRAYGSKHRSLYSSKHSTPENSESECPTCRGLPPSKKDMIIRSSGKWQDCTLVFPGRLQSSV